MAMTAVASQIRVPESFGRSVIVFGALAMLVLAGCSGEQKSLYEHDHVTPAHLSNDLPHAAQLFRERMAILQTGENGPAGNELSDLVKWIPQVAADTDLPEDAWNQLNQVAGQVQEQLPVLAIERNSNLEKELLQMLELIDSAAKTLERLAPRPAENPLSSGPFPELRD